MEPISESESYFQVNTGIIRSAINRWKENLPMVMPYYAVKCNPDPLVLQMMSTAGFGFDCASKKEIEKVLRIVKSPVSQILYANPVKNQVDLKFAYESGVRLMTFDSKEELKKIKRIAPRAQILLRISTDDKNAQCPLSNKFGASRMIAKELINEATNLGLDLVGISFHVGSGGASPEAFRIALDEAVDLLPRMTVLDIGGGFIEENFVNCASVIRNYARPGLTMIAEPGRFFVSKAFRLVTRVIGKKPDSITINDGVYGALNCIIYDHAKVTPITFRGGPKRVQTIFGQTCDGFDVIGQFLLPELDLGDPIYFENLGAYSSAAASSFNGFNNNYQMKYYCSGCAGCNI